MALIELTNSNEQLDAVLTCLNYWSNEEDKAYQTNEVDGITISTFILSHEHKEYRKISDFHFDLAALLGVKMNSHTIKLALEYLSSEKMVIYQTISCTECHEISGYRILYKGKVLIENGGFVREKEINELENTRLRNLEKLQTQNAEKMNRLTFWLVLFSALLLLIELIKLVTQDYPYFPSWNSLFH